MILLDFAESTQLFQ